MTEKKRRPARVADFLPPVLRDRGLAGRVEQAAVVERWARLVGPRIASVTRAQSVTPDGVLRIGVRTNAWMHELSLMAPELLRSINAEQPNTPIRRIQFRLLDPGDP